MEVNRPEWRVIEADIKEVDGIQFRGVDLVAAGVPCPPFTIAGKQLGRKDERDRFPEALNIVKEAEPAAVMLENVRGFASSRFDSYRRRLIRKLEPERVAFVAVVLGLFPLGPDSGYKFRVVVDLDRWVLEDARWQARQD